MPLIDLFPGSHYDKMHTAAEHIAMMISRHINDKMRSQPSRILVTGGGAHNIHLTDRIRHYSHAEVVVPDPLIVDFKEALVMAFFGLRRIRQEVNCYSSVTGASANCCGGAVYAPPA